MKRRPRVLDLFCGAGGASMGYYRAGFEVIGIDIKRQLRYPFPFLQVDALQVTLSNFDLVHASPPCQSYTRTVHITRSTGRMPTGQDLLEPTRRRLQMWGGPYIIENVEGAPLWDPILLCGSMFGLGVRRHRLFETNIPGLMDSIDLECDHATQGKVVGVYGKKGNKIPGGAQVARSVAEAKEVMGISWMTQWDELREAIPPAYTNYLAKKAFPLIKNARTSR